MRKNVLSILALTLVAAAPPTPAPAPHLGNWSPALGAFCFPSGLRIVLQEDHARPLVAVATVHQGGFGDDTPGAEGTAHLAEHLWFRTRHGEVDVTEQLETSAASWNAFTARETTRFETVAPRGALPTLLRLEATRLVEGLAGLTDADVDVERSIVVSEGHFGAEPLVFLRNDAIASAQFPATHPYHRAATATADSLRGVSRDAVMAWAKAHWRPSETTMVLTGDFTREAAWGELNRLLPAAVLGLQPDEAFRPGICPARLPAQQPDPPLPASTTLSHVPAPVTQQTLVVSWALPGGLRTGEAEMYVVADVLETLAQAYVSRLVEEDRADERVVCGVEPRPLASILSCAVEVDAMRTPERVRRAITTAAADLRGSGAAHLTYPELFDVAWREHQAGLLASMEDTMAIGAGRTALVANYVHTTGSPTYTRDHMAWGDAVTADSLEALAHRWLTDTRQVAVVLDPEPALVVGAGERALLAAPRKTSAPIPADVAAITVRYGLPPLDHAERTLDTGLRLAALRVRGQPRIRAGIVYRGSEWAAPSEAVALLAVLGTSARYAQGVDPKPRDPTRVYGAWLSGWLSFADLTGVVVPAGNLENALFMLRDRLRAERFEATTANVDARRLLARARATEDGMNLASLRAWSVFAPTDDRLMSNLTAQFAAADAASARDAAAWSAALRQPANTTVLVVGDLEPSVLLDRAAAWFSDWKVKDPPPVPTVRLAVRAPMQRTLAVVPDASERSAAVTLRCATDQDWAVEALLASLVEHGALARLREQLGVAYAVEGSREAPVPGLHGIVVRATVEPDVAGLAARELLEELAAAGSVSAEDVDRARLRVATARGQAFQDSDALFTRIVEGAVAGSPWAVADEPAQLAGVSAAQVAEAARSCVGHEVVTAAGPEAPIRASLTATGLPAR